MKNMKHPASAEAKISAASSQSQAASVSDLLTEEDAAQFLGILPRTCRAWRNSRGLPHLKITSKVVRYRRGDIESWLDQHRVAIRSA